MQGNRLTLPALELIYVWNGFSIIGKKPELLCPLQAIVENTLTVIEKNKGDLSKNIFAAFLNMFQDNISSNKGQWAAVKSRQKIMRDRISFVLGPGFPRDFSNDPIVWTIGTKHAREQLSTTR